MFDDKLFLLRINSGIELSTMPPSKLGDNTKSYISYLEKRVLDLENIRQQSHSDKK